MAGKWVDNSDPNAPHEAKLLSLSIEKAGALLGWYPAWDFTEAIRPPSSGIASGMI